MKGAKKNILETIGNTPIVRLNKIGSDLPCNLFAKLEYFNPGHSIKDRIGWFMIEQAVKRGDLKPGGTVIESTSGNTGIGLAIAAIIEGFRVIFVLPDKVSTEKIANLRAFGARVITCPTAVEPEDPRSYYSVSKRLNEEIPNSYYCNQYNNPDNPESHYRQTGPEIWEQTGGEVDTIVLGIGTGGTVTGVGKYLKEKRPSIKMIGIDPIGSMYHGVFHKGDGGELHGYLIEGIGEDFMPDSIENLKYLDDVIQISDKDAYFWARELVRQEGIFSGSSAGAAIAGALEYGKRAAEGENILIILPDSGSKYLSKVYNDDWLRENGLLDSHLEGTIGDVLAWKGSEVLSVTSDATVQETVHMMQERGISQIPVLKDNEPVGIVTESALLSGLCTQSIADDDTVAKVISPRFAQLDRDEPLENLVDALSKADLAIVRDGETLAGVVTKIDLLTHLTEKSSR